MSQDQSLQKLAYLVIDDFPSARKQVRGMLVQMGVNTIFEAGNASQAKRVLKDQPIDIVICDFNLGTGQDGQQLLEEMRSTGEVTHVTQWVIITAETSKDMVMGAIENEPDDYLAKPFAFDTFQLRLKKWVRRFHELAPLLKTLDTGTRAEIIEACQQTMTHLPRYRSWARKMMISTLIHDRQLDTAEEILDAVLAKRHQDWALHEKARIQMLNKQFEPAMTMLEEVVTINPNNVAAYDHLAACYLEVKQPIKAQQTLVQAARISPRNLKRQRRLAKLSRQLKDYNVSARAYKEVLSLSNNTLHDSPENYVNLAETLNTAARQGGDGKIRNATRQAMELAQRMSQRFPDKVSVSLKSRIIQINANDIQGLDKVRDKQLDKLFEQSMNNIDSLEQDFTLDIARALYNFDRQQQGDEWVDALRRKYIDDSKFQQKLMMLQSEPVSDIAKARAAELNKAGNTCYRNEDFPGALEKFSLALEYSPRHPGLILNIAQAYLKLYLDKPDPSHLSNMEDYLKRLIHLPQDHYQYERFQTLVQRLIALQEEAN